MRLEQPVMRREQTIGDRPVVPEALSRILERPETVIASDLLDEHPVLLGQVLRLVDDDEIVRRPRERKRIDRCAQAHLLPLVGARWPGEVEPALPEQLEREAADGCDVDSRRVDGPPEPVGERFGEGEDEDALAGRGTAERRLAREERLAASGGAIDQEASVR